MGWSSLMPFIKGIKLHLSVYDLTYFTQKYLENLITIAFSCGNFVDICVNYENMKQCLAK